MTKAGFSRARHQLGIYPYMKPPRCRSCTAKYVLTLITSVFVRDQIVHSYYVLIQKALKAKQTCKDRSEAPSENAPFIFVDLT